MHPASVVRFISMPPPPYGPECEFDDIFRFYPKEITTAAMRENGVLSNMTESTVMRGLIAIPLDELISSQPYRCDSPDCNCYTAICLIDIAAQRGWLEVIDYLVGHIPTEKLRKYAFLTVQSAINGHHPESLVHIMKHYSHIYASEMERAHQFCGVSSIDVSVVNALIECAPFVDDSDEFMTKAMARVMRVYMQSVTNSLAYSSSRKPHMYGALIRCIQVFPMVLDVNISRWKSTYSTLFMFVCTACSLTTITYIVNHILPDGYVDRHINAPCNALHELASTTRTNMPEYAQKVMFLAELAPEWLRTFDYTERTAAEVESSNNVYDTIQTITGSMAKRAI